VTDCGIANVKEAKNRWASTEATTTSFRRYTDRSTVLQRSGWIKDERLDARKTFGDFHFSAEVTANPNRDKPHLTILDHRNLEALGAVDECIGVDMDPRLERRKVEMDICIGAGCQRVRGISDIDLYKKRARSAVERISGTGDDSFEAAPRQLRDPFGFKFLKRTSGISAFFARYIALIQGMMALLSFQVTKARFEADDQPRFATAATGTLPLSIPASFHPGAEHFIVDIDSAISQRLIEVVEYALAPCVR
jgi:hypothetical protein